MRQRKEVLLLESSLNRLKLQAEMRNLRGVVSPGGGLAGKVQELFPLLMLLAPVAGFFASRGARRGGSLAERLGSAVKLILPLYQLWKRFS